MTERVAQVFQSLQIGENVLWVPRLKGLCCFKQEGRTFYLERPLGARGNESFAVELTINVPRLGADCGVPAGGEAFEKGPINGKSKLTVPDDKAAEKWRGFLMRYFIG